MIESVNNSAREKPKVTQSARRLNLLGQANNAKTYLEVGVQSGATFLGVEVPHKVAVDPVFKFVFQNFANSETEFYPITSDQFFYNLPLERKFDLIFLDGLHTFEQTFRDFCNSLLHCHERTIWIIDDTVPSDIYSAHKVQSEAVARRVAEGGDKTKRAWHGDVYKTIFAIHDFFPAISYCTPSTGGHKQTILWQEKRNEPVLFDGLEAISRLDYFGYLKFSTELHFMPESKALQRALDRFRDVAD